MDLKFNSRIQTRVILIIAVIVFIFTAALVLLKISEDKKVESIFKERQIEKNKSFQKTKISLSRSLELFAYDYTVWDEMLRFVRTGNPAWAKENIDVSLKTYETDAAYVFRTDYSLLYFVSDLNKKTPIEIGPVKDIIEHSAKDNYFFHYFIFDSNKLYEVRTAPIQPSSDIQRKSKPAGYFFVVKELSDEYLAEFSIQSSSKVSLESINENEAKQSDPFIIISSSILCDWNSKPIAILVSKNDFSVMRNSSSLFLRQMIVFIAFTFLVLVIVSYFMIKQVSNPLKQISLSLAHENPDLIKHLAESKNEFSKISSLITQFFIQKNKLVEEILQRKLTEISLNKSEAKYRKIFENIQDIFYQADLNGVITAISPSIERYLGYKPDEVTGNPIWNFYEKNPQTEMFLNQLKSGTEIFDYEITLLTKNGKKVFCSVNSHSIKNDAGEIFGIEGTLRDISERKSAELELEKTKIHFQKLIEKAPDGVVLISMQNSFKYISPSAYKMFGYSPDEIDLLLPDELTHPDDLQYVLSVIGEIIQDPAKIPTIQYRFKHKSGRWIWIESTFTNLFLEPSVEAIVINFRDVTDRKNAQELLELSEERYRTLIQSAPVGVLLEDDIGTILEVNNSFCKLMGYEKNEIVGNNIRMFSSPDNYDLINKNIHELLSGKVLEHIVDSVTKDGKHLSIQLSETRIILADNRMGILSISSDVTAQKESLKRIRNLSRTVEQSPALVVLTDIHGNIEYINPKFTDVTGFTLEDVIGKNPRILKSGYTSAESYKKLWDTITQKKEWSGEFYNRKKNGELYWVSANISPILDEHGELINYLGIYEDITEKKKITDELVRAKEKAEEMNRIKSYFYANMSHELRTPFVGILGYSELLAETLLNADQRNMANQILKSSRRLTDTLNKVLNITKLEFDKIIPSQRNVVLKEMIDNLQTLFIISAEQKNTVIKTEYNSQYTSLMTDEKLLNEVLTNLINNAIKFTSNGVINIIVSDKLTGTDKYLVIKVADTGVGIAADKQNIIWEEFRQASEGLNRSFEGTGLGLTIAKKYTELLGGQIFLESEMGKGSTFTVELPLVSGAGITLPKPGMIVNENESVTIKHAHPKILYVEDDVVSKEFINVVLTKNNFDIETAADAEAALVKVTENVYDLLLVDINLGHGLDGVQLTNQIRQMGNYKDVPIVALTAYASTTDKNEFLRNGFSHYLSKPFSINDLIKLLTDALALS